MLAGVVLTAGALGAVFGSFLNVVAHRLPRGESVVRPRSRCPRCEAPIRAYDNVPVFSWLALRGRCRSCAQPISARYPLIELATGLLIAAVTLAAETPSQALLGVALVVLLVPIALIDLDHRIIPNRLTATGSVAALLIVGASAPGDLPEHLAAAAGAGGLLLAAALARPGGMGMGDVKLAGMLGLFLGSAVAPAMLVALLSGSLLGAAVIARVGAEKGRRTAIPFGPFLALGGLVGLLAGDALIAVYVERFLV